VLTPRQVPQSPQVSHSPLSVNRSSLPPFQQNHFSHGYTASPLQQALTPPAYETGLDSSGQPPFPSVETGDSFQNPATRNISLSDSSPSLTGRGIQIYCAACQNVSPLKESYACTECICGICQQCVDVLMAEQGARRRCPRCATVGGKFKPFQLEIR
jgi:hypothetical protein